MDDLFKNNSEFYKLSNLEYVDPNNGRNGRLLVDPNQNKPFDLFKGSSQPHYLGNRLNHRMEATPLSDAYFSKDNVDKVQILIRNAVRYATDNDNDPILTGYKPINISRQNDTELAIVMRSVYLQYGKNLNYNIQKQIEKLNNIVINEVVPGIISALKQKIKYLYDLEHLPVPLSHPENVSNKGEKIIDVSSVFTNAGSGTFDLF